MVCRLQVSDGGHAVPQVFLFCNFLSRKKRGKGFPFFLESHKHKFTKIDYLVSSVASRKRIICICVGYFLGEKRENRTEAQVESIEKAPVGTHVLNIMSKSQQRFIM